MTHGSQQSHDQLCIRCNLTQECQEHWYKCSKSQEFLQQQRETTIRFLTKSGLHSSLHGLILQAVYDQPWVHTSYQEALYQYQTEIGWSQFLRGRITKEWARQQDYLSKQTNGTSIMTKVLTHIFLVMHDAWLYRNQQWHGCDPLIQKRHFDSFIKPRVIFLYGKKHLLNAHDQQIMDVPLSTPMNNIFCMLSNVRQKD
jgi:hypothetical protein